jgi:RNA polymerase sigma-70 factor (ECF subfamily)
MTCHDKIEEERARRFRDVALPCLDDAYTLAHLLMRNRADAEDAVQECYLRALRHFDSWRGDAIKGDNIKPGTIKPDTIKPDTIKPWLFTILRNVCYAELGRRRRKETPADLADDKHSAEQLFWQEPQPHPESEVLNRQEGAALRQLIASLPAAFREAIVLREFNDMRYREIAKVTGVPIGTVMSRLARARAMLLAAWKARDSVPQRKGGKRLPPPRRTIPTILADS